MTSSSAGAAIPSHVLQRLRLVCLDLPEASEQRAWAGIRWVVAKKNFAHVLMIDAGYPPAYAKAAGSDGPLCVLTFRAPRPDIEAPRFKRSPFFLPPWFDNIVGMSLDETTDWDDVQHRVIESYRVLAPKRLSGTMDGL
jgi:hypothetical protein